MDTNPYERWIGVEPLNQGELQVKDYLRANGYTVADVSDNPTYWKQDIDILAYKDSLEDEIAIEVKNDGVISRSGNFFIELFSDIDKCQDGWFSITCADYIYYRDRENKLVYVLPLNNLKDYVAAHKEELEVGWANDYTRDGRIKKISSGYKLPVSSYLTAYPDTQIIHI